MDKETVEMLCKLYRQEANKVRCRTAYREQRDLRLAYLREKRAAQRTDPLLREKVRAARKVQCKKYKETRKRYIDAHRAKINETSRKSAFKTRYGITEADFWRMVEEQDSKCKACGVKFEGVRKHMHIDHCHVSGAIRGVLCSACNLSLGTMKESADRLFRLAKYAEQIHRNNK